MLHTLNRLTSLTAIANSKEELFIRYKKYTVVLCFCNVHCNIIIQYKPTKCTFSKLIFFNFIFDVFTRFEPEGSTLGKRWYTQFWHSTF